MLAVADSVSIGFSSLFLFPALGLFSSLLPDLDLPSLEL